MRSRYETNYVPNLPDADNEAIGRLNVVMAIIDRHEDDFCGPRVYKEDDPRRRELEMDPEGWDLRVVQEALVELRDSLRRSL